MVKDAEFCTVELSTAPVETAPDGSLVHVLAKVAGGSSARFELPAGAVSVAVVHKSVDEIWYFVSGSGRFWRGDANAEQTVNVRAGTSLSVAQGVCFQFAADPGQPLVAVGFTVPAWPGDAEAQPVEGPWQPTV